MEVFAPEGKRGILGRNHRKAVSWGTPLALRWKPEIKKR